MAHRPARVFRAHSHQGLSHCDHPDSGAHGNTRFRQQLPRIALQDFVPHRRRHERCCFRHRPPEAAPKWHRKRHEGRPRHAFPRNPHRPQQGTQRQVLLARRLPLGHAIQHPGRSRHVQLQSSFRWRHRYQGHARVLHPLRPHPRAPHRARHGGWRNRCAHLSCRHRYQRNRRHHGGLLRGLSPLLPDVHGHHALRHEHGSLDH